MRNTIVSILVLGCNAAPAVAPDADICSALAETACNANVGCFAEYSTSNEAGQIGGDFVRCVAGSAACTLPAGCGYGGVGCPQSFTVAFTLENPNVCDVGVDISCVRPEKCRP